MALPSKQIVDLDPIAAGEITTDAYLSLQSEAEDEAERVLVLPTIIVKNTSFTFNPTLHAGNIIHVTSATPIDCTMPNNVTKFMQMQVMQRSTGYLRFVAASGATILTYDGLVATAGLNAIGVVQWVDNVGGVAAKWSVFGQMGASS